MMKMFDVKVISHELRVDAESYLEAERIAREKLQKEYPHFNFKYAAFIINIIGPSENHD